MITLGVMIQENVSLKPYNTFGVEASTKFFAEATSLGELEEILAWYREQNDCPLLVLGGGSNLLFTRDWKGLVLKVSLTGCRVEGDMAIAAAGEDWHSFVLWTLEKKIFGLENLSLIPGQVGTAPMQNIGAYGVEIKDVFESLKAININSGKTKIFSLDECEFGYRESVFKHKEKGNWIITEVSFKLSKTPQVKVEYGTIKTTLEAHNIKNPTPQQVGQAVTAIRESKLPNPNDLGSAGSFFKNPVVAAELLQKIKTDYPEVPHYKVADKQFKLPAGWLIDQSGWKGHTRDNHGVHKHQALVLVNYGGATGEDILTLAKDIQQSVAKKFDIILKPEVNII